MIDSLVILFPDWGRFDIVFSVFLGYKMFIGEEKNALFPSRKFLFVDFFWFVLPLQAVLLIQCLFIKGWVEPKSKSLQQIIIVL